MENSFYKAFAFFQKIPLRQKFGVGVLFLSLIICLKFFSGHEAPLEPAPLPKVVTKTLHAISVTPCLLLTGHTEALVRTLIKAETPGKISTLITTKGQIVKKGTPLVSLENADYLEKLSQAQANLEHWEAEFESANKLKKKDFYSQNNLLATKTNLELSKATLARAKHDADNLTIKAPYDGLYDNIHAEVGEYVTAGQHVITFLQPTPVKICASVSEDEHQQLTQNNMCTATIRGQKFQAKITYLSHKADEKTRTYALECILDDTTISFPDGLTASLSLPTKTVIAHKIPASALTLNDQGVLGLMIAKEGKAHFVKADVIESNQEGTVVTGLPEHIDLIVVGGEFLKSEQPIQTETKK